MGLLVGAAVGVVFERVLGRPLDRFIVDPIAARRTAARLQRVNQRYGITGEMLRIAGHHLFVRQYTASGFRRADLVGTLGGDLLLADRHKTSSVGRLLPPLDELEREIALERQRIQSDPTQWNGTKLSLTSLEVSRTPDTEEPVLQMHFHRSDHASMSVIGRLWQGCHAGDPARILDGDLLRTVDPLLSHSFGMNATLETADGMLLVTKRGRGTSGWHGRWHTSVNEGTGPMDASPGGRVDVLDTLVRGIREEIGADIASIQDVAGRMVVHTLMLDVDRYEWGMLAHVDLRGTSWSSTEILAARAIGAAHDDWEASELRLLPFTVETVIEECMRPAEWIPHGLLNLVTSAVTRYPRETARLRGALLAASAT